MIKAWLPLAALTATALFTLPAAAQTPGPAAGGAPDGAAVFEAHCKMCHEPPVGRAPEKADLATRPKADIVTALTSGLMAPMASGLSPAEIDAVASYLTGSAAATR